MRIPLDYYRILSVPIQASAEQLDQAYSDRLLQEPRREFNEQAILARQELIQQAYQILTHSEQRAAYDAQFLVNLQPLETLEIAEQVETADSAVADNPKPCEPTTVNPSIEIPASQLVGALLILHELGEYELLLKLGIESLNSREFNEHLQQQEKAIKIAIWKNMILSMALAYLELGREQWHRREYENAALADQMGLDLLIKENLFSQVQEELELDLYKLRPYRVLELISQNPTDSPEREQAFQLLREMLHQRQGIEGKGEDRSGLSFDQFLCFVQQLRTYLTSAEQQQLFEAEAKSNSAIANYLAVYALLGRGFSLKQPELILRAQRMLDLLSDRQDVAWEQSVSALLLGHTEKAISKLQDIQDTTKLDLIKQNSLNNNDLLPALCFYSEQWLQAEVVAQFPDLSAFKITLKEYFADREVQTYLEELITSIPAVVSDKQKAIDHQSDQSRVKISGIFSRWRNLFSAEKLSSVKAIQSKQAVQPERELVAVGAAENTPETAALKRNYHNAGFSHPTKSPPRRKVTSTLTTQKRRSLNRHSQSPSLPLKSPAKKSAVPSSVIQQYQGQKVNQRQSYRRHKKPSKATIVKGWLFILSLILGVGTTGFMAMKLFLNPAPKIANKAQLAIAIGQPAVELSPVSIKPVATSPKLTFDQQSQQVIQQWLTSKSAAFGKGYQIEKLDNILAEPLLGTWRNRAVAYKQGDFYREYEHKIKLRSATISQNNPNKATVEAEVQEVAQHYQSGKLDQAQSYNDNLLVRYQLVRQGENWLIQDSEVLKTL